MEDIQIYANAEFSRRPIHYFDTIADKMAVHGVIGSLGSLLYIYDLSTEFCHMKMNHFAVAMYANNGVNIMSNMYHTFT